MIYVKELDELKLSETGYPIVELKKPYDMLETIIYSEPYLLNRQQYKIHRSKHNRGDKYGLPHVCNWEKDKDMNNQFIPIGDETINLLEISQPIPDSERKFFRTFKFHNEECLINWLNEFNPEDRL